MSQTPNENANPDELEIVGDEDGPQQGPQAGGADSNEVLKLRAERDDLYKKLARAQADFQNSRRRLEADKEQAVQFANAQLIKTLLPVIDNFERALAQDPAKTNVPDLLKGMQIVHDQWLAVLGQQSVEAITPQPGDPFDPATMQALMQQEDGRFVERKEPTVTMLLQKGYRMNDRVLRPAQVAVSKTSS